MAGKKSKYRDKLKKIDLTNLKPPDIICPICRTILCEPVTLPCNHIFCKLCFDGAMENANLVCPLCRVRVSSWYRKAKKEGNLIDEILWSAVKIQYPNEVQNKFKGIDNVIEEEQPTIIVCTPGEIRKEYELQKRKQEEEIRKKHDAEEKASEALIKKIKAEEEYRKQLIDEKLRLDEELARKLSKELSPSTSKLDPLKRKSGPLDKFIKNKSNKGVKDLPKNEQSENSQSSSTKKNSSPNNFSTKPYTCQVLYIDSNPVDKVSYVKIKSSVETKVTKMNSQNFVNINERKAACQSECRSNGSGDNSDVIDQECKFYFKPIDAQKKHHVQGSLPVKIHCKKSLPCEEKQIIPPNGMIVNFPSDNISAFAQVSIKSVEKDQSIHLEKDTSVFYGFSTRDICESVASCDNMLKLFSKLDRDIFKRKTLPPSPSDMTVISSAMKKLKYSCTINNSKVTKKRNIEVKSCNEKLPVNMNKPPQKELTGLYSKNKSESQDVQQKAISDKHSFNISVNNADIIHTTISIHPAVTVSPIKLKNSPKKLRFNSHIATSIKSLPLDSIISLEQRKLQEESDFQLAKKLQAEFDMIQLPSRTRRGTTRQITLDEMLLI